MQFNQPGKNIMTYKELGTYQEFEDFQIQTSWNECIVGLEHAISGNNYWVGSDARFYTDGKLELYIYLKGGQEEDPKILFSTLEAHGFKKVKRRVMREWEYYHFERNENRESNPKLNG